VEGISHCHKRVQRKQTAPRIRCFGLLQ
jgi:hypothetical protein